MESLRCSHRSWRARAAALALAAHALGCGGDLESRMAEVRALQDVGQFQASIDLLREVLVVAPDLPEASYRLGLALVQTGERSRAIWSLQKASESDDYLIPAGSLLATVHLANHDFDEALRVVNRVLERDPERNVALQLRAKANIGAKRFEDALADTRRLVELFPDDYTAYGLHATALLDTGRLEEAQIAHELLKKLGAESGDPELESRGCIAPAVFAREQLDDQERAAALYEDCLERMPDRRLVLTQAAEFFDAIGQPERSTEIYRAAIERAPENLSLRASLANRLRGGGDLAGAEQILVEAAETFGSAQAWNLLTSFYRGTGQPQKALPAIEKVIELSRGGSDATRFVKADVLVDLGELDDAAEVAESLSEPTYAALIRGRILMEQGDAEAALRAFDQGIRNWPNNAAARYLAGVAAREVGDFERAISELREAVRVDKEATEAALVLSRLHLDRGEYQKALTFANSYLQNRPHGAREQAYRISARALVALQRFPAARRSIELLAQVPGQELATALERAALERQQNGAAAAVAVIEQSGLDWADPAREELLRDLCDHLLAAGRTDEALARVSTALERRPEAASLHEIRGTLLARRNRTAEARAAYERAIELDPRNAIALGGLATLAARGGENARAIELFDRAAALGSDTVQYEYAAAQLALGGGDSDGAERRLRSVVERSPSHAGARNDLAWILSEKGDDLDLALALAQEARQLDRSANVLDTLGWVHLKRGDARSAVNILEQAAEMEPGSPSIRYHLAVALSEAGDAERAREMLKAAVDAGAFPELDAAKKKLEQL